MNNQQRKPAIMQTLISVIILCIVQSAYLQSASKSSSIIKTKAMLQASKEVSTIIDGLAESIASNKAIGETSKKKLITDLRENYAKNKRVLTLELLKLKSFDEDLLCDQDDIDISETQKGIRTALTSFVGPKKFDNFYTLLVNKLNVKEINFLSPLASPALFQVLLKSCAWIHVGNILSNGEAFKNIEVITAEISAPHLKKPTHTKKPLHLSYQKTVDVWLLHAVNNSDALGVMSSLMRGAKPSESILKKAIEGGNKEIIRAIQLQRDTLKKEEAEAQREAKNASERERKKSADAEQKRIADDAAQSKEQENKECKEKAAVELLAQKRAEIRRNNKREKNKIRKDKKAAEAAEAERKKQLAHVIHYTHAAAPSTARSFSRAKLITTSSSSSPNFTRDWIRLDYNSSELRKIHAQKELAELRAQELTIILQKIRANNKKTTQLLHRRWIDETDARNIAEINREIESLGLPVYQTTYKDQDDNE